MAPRRHPWLAPAVFTGAASPLVILPLRGMTGRLSADPVAFTLNQLGLLALIFLIASLACTPLRLLSGWSWPITLRRQLGLWAFTYAALHGLFYLSVDQGFDFRALGEEILRRPFIAVGVTALLLLVPLALTSTAASVKRLGAKRWRRIHRLAYLAAGLGVLHFFLRVKADVTEPLTYGVVLGLLLAIRLFEPVLRSWRARRQPATESVSRPG